ncbi:hypothetical protein [Acidovorax sp. RAC01]|uniref:hypothetical protein n=1 Tax=Acidovorax sp. RAC01 TaxID=1842533 RepID=UPI0012EAF33F|nr:hypothetical protein [Acidovorax sp. RAC01]
MSRTPMAQADAARPQNNQHSPADEPSHDPGAMEPPSAQRTTQGPQEGPAETLYMQYGMVRSSADASDTPDAQRGHGTGANQPHTQEHLDAALQERRDEQLRLAESEEHPRPDVGTEHSTQDIHTARDTPPTATEPATIGGLVNPLANGAGNPQTWDHARARSAALGAALGAAGRPGRVEGERQAPPSSAEGSARGD